MYRTAKEQPQTSPIQNGTQVTIQVQSNNSETHKVEQLNALSPMNFLMLFLYVAIWTLLTLLIRESRKNGTYQYEPSSMVLLMETSKLVLSLSLVIYQGNLPELIANFKTGVYFAVPAFIYTIYNNLMFINLDAFDATTYRVLLNFRIITTGILTILIFKKSLSAMRWVALILLFIGCSLSAYKPPSPDQIQPTDQSQNIPFPVFSVFLLLIQGFCSSSAAIYNEYLLKGDAKMNINVQNSYLYMSSVIFNLIFTVMLQDFNVNSLFKNYEFINIIILALGAFGGFITSVILKYLNAIYKEYLTAIEVISTGILAHFFFNEHITIQLLFASVIVCTSIIVYNKNP